MQFEKPNQRNRRSSLPLSSFLKKKQVAFTLNQLPYRFSPSYPLLGDCPYSFLFILAGNFFGCPKKWTVVILYGKKIGWMWWNLEASHELMTWRGKKFPDNFFWNCLELIFYGRFCKKLSIKFLTVLTKPSGNNIYRRFRKKLSINL
jgi:hypothetical protein